jgi:hypothetical protein
MVSAYVINYYCSDMDIGYSTDWTSINMYIFQILNKNIIYIIEK